MIGTVCIFDIPASLANVILEQPAGSIESIADRDIDILMRMVRRRITANDDLVTGYVQVDANLEQIALKTARVPAFDDDTA